MSPHLPRHRLEELAAREDPELRAHVDGCAECAERLQGLLDARAAFVQGRDPRTFARAVVSRPTKRRVPWTFAAALAVAAAVTLLWSPPSEIRYKGSQSLQVFVQRQGRPTLLQNGQALAAGDQLAFAYSLPEARYLLLLSIDDAGAITRYYPGDATRSKRLDPATRAQLPIGIELDDHRGEERLVALFSREPIDEATAREALRTALRESGLAAMGQLPLPGEQASVWFRKP